MASSNGNLLGEPFKDYVNDQIVARQKVHGKKNRTLKEIQYLNSRNAWIKLASGVFIEQERLDLLKKNAKKAGGSNTLLEGVNEGMELALRNVLFNGLSSFGSIDDQTSKEINQFTAASQNKMAATYFRKFADNTQKQRSGIKGSNRAYGVGGTSEYGYSPMPGIIDANIRDLNRGSIKKATINLKCHNRAQFDIIDVLYMRLGYTVLLEWGNDKYLSGVDSQGNGKLSQMGTTLADKEWWVKNRSSYAQALPAIEALRRKYHGNYDGIFGTISNFSWTFNDDGSYDIKLELISQGDIIESLKANLPPHEGGNEENGLDAYQKVIAEKLKTGAADNQTEFYDVLYRGEGGPSFEDIIDDWLSNPNGWKWGIETNGNKIVVGQSGYPDVKTRSSGANFNLSNSVYWPGKDLPLYLFVRQDPLTGFKFPSFNAGNYKGPNEANTNIIVNGIGYDGETGVVETAILNSLIDIKIAGGKDLVKYYESNYLDAGKTGKPTTIYLRNSEGLIRTKRVFFGNRKQLFYELYLFSMQIYKQDGGVFYREKISGTTVNIARMIWYYNSVPVNPKAQVDFPVGTFNSLFKNGIYESMKDQKIAGGADSQNEAANASETPVSEEQQAEIDNETELEEGKFKNKITDYLFKVRKFSSFYSNGQEGKGGYLDSNGNVVFPILIPGREITSPKIEIGQVLNPPIKDFQRDDIEPILKQWNSEVGYPNYLANSNNFDKEEAEKLLAEIKFDPRYSNFTIEDFKPGGRIDTQTNIKVPGRENNPVDFIKTNITPLNKQYFIRLGTLLNFIEKKIIPKIDSSTLSPMLKIDTNVKTNICYALDNMLSLDPNKTIIRTDNFYIGSKDSNGQNVTVNLYEGLNIFTNKKSDKIWGNIMNIYFNFDRVEELFNDVDDKNQVSIFGVLNNLATDINSSLGNVNNIEPIIDKETNTVKFIDQTPIPNLSGIANFLGIPFVDRKILPALEIFGYDTVTPTQKGQSTFVRKAGITTAITKEYATIISIGATANGAIPGAESTAFSKWNVGIKDRFKNDIIDGEAQRGDNLQKQNEEVLNKYNTFISKPFNKLGFTQQDTNFLINDEFISLNKNRAQNYYIYAQAENSKKDGHSIESSIGFLPFNLKLEMDGLSGFKIYNRVKVNTSFLPSNYGNTLDFIVTGVNHRLSNNEWVTDLETIATTKDIIA